MNPVFSFPPIAKPNAVALLLGSMPGKESLAKKQYYAHPRNAFWPIMGELFGAGFSVPYSKRQVILKENRVAVWDVLQECIRPGSLDSAIHQTSEVPNNFEELFKRCPKIETIFFNGKKAAQTFKRLVYPQLDKEYSGLKQIALPSTSPAYAAMPFQEKLEQWRNLVEYLS